MSTVINLDIWQRVWKWAIYATSLFIYLHLQEEVDILVAYFTILAYNSRIEIQRVDLLCKGATRASKWIYEKKIK